MLLRKTLHEKSPDILRVVAPPINITEERASDPLAKPQVAVLITHGMGQQVPFETLDTAAEGLILAANRNGNHVKVIRARTVLIGEVKTQRAEFDMRDAAGKDVEVHVYEGYWAPITEGQVTLRDVMMFLFSAGFKGMWNGLQNFERWIFGRPVPFGKQCGASLYLLATLAIVTTLVALNFAIAIVTLIFITGHPLSSYDCLKWIGEPWLPIIWCGVLFVTWYVRKVLVQYMGDVAAYVDSHSLDRFDDIRTRIKARVFEQAKAVYSNPQYERIAMMGHSLGSVATYDTLNALINFDALHKNKLDVIGRTKLLLTFGSPLDKIAFIFASQIRKATATREALAATLQPLIQAYSPFRNIKWINIYSKCDIVSGALTFYDDSQATGYSLPRAVKNVEDADANTLLKAHIEYWNNPTLFDELYEHL